MSPARRSRLIKLVVVLAAVAGVWAVTLKPWRPFVYGTVAAPAPELDGLEPALVARLKLARLAVVKRPYAAGAWGRYGGILEIHDLVPEAIACYERAERLDRGAFAWAYGLGRSLLATDLARAVPQLERAIALAPDYAPARVRLGFACVAAERVDDAGAQFREALRLDPRLVAAHVGLAEVALAHGDDGPAAAHLERALALGASGARVRWLAAEAARRLGDDDAAARHAEAAERASQPSEPIPDPVFDELVEAEGVTLKWRKRRAGILAARGDAAGAIREWETVRRDQPDALEPILAIGLLKLRVNDRAGAIDAFTAALRIDPDQPKVRGNLGGLLLGAGRADEGLAELRAAARAMPDDAAAHANVARALRTMNRVDEALASAERALAIDPAHALARREHLAATATIAWRLATSPDDAVRDGAAARAMMAPLCARTDPPNPWLLDVLAAACAEDGDLAEALRHARRARDLYLATPPRPGEPPGRRMAVLTALDDRIMEYEAGRPWREARMSGRGVEFP